ncbi:DUF1056 family protein [Lactiplantibacillus paraxiangfangensis]|uniref:DUF1056 family protein n=1 Tax=Lactiplantibacillus paraxiangfangensis TaxID=3076224 RepID=UPI0030C7561F
MSKVIETWFANWFTVILFVGGAALIAVAAFLFNLAVGYLASGVELCVIAYILDKERGEQ